MFETEFYILNALKEEYKYIARDGNGTLYAYYEKPTLGEKFYYVESDKFLNLSFLKGGLFSNIIFGDEPKKIKNLISLYKIDN